MPHATPSRWQLRDILAAAALALATAAMVLHQNLHLAVLWDLSYTLETAFRISLGQVPYRDFPLVHAPLTFLVQAVLIKLTGRVYWHHAVYAAVAGAAATVLTWRILLRTLREAWVTALLLALPLTVLGNYCILPFPSYDCDCTLAILATIYCLQRLADGESSVSLPRGFGAERWVETAAKPLLAGASLVLPLFIKQNIGLPFLLTGLAALILAIVANHCLHKPTKFLLLTFSGAATTLALALLALQFTVGLGNYLHWTITFARQRRLPGLADMLGIYTDPTLLWTLPCLSVALILLYAANKRRALDQDSESLFGRALTCIAYVLLAAPFLNILLSLTPSHDADDRASALLSLWPLILIGSAAHALYRLRRRPTLTSLTPFLILAAINGTLLSQQLWGSTYAIWPLFLLLLANLVATLPAHRLTISLTATIAGTLLLTGTLYTLSEERLSYAKVTAEAGPPATSALPALRGMSVRGPFLPAFDELVRYTDQNIPREEPLILLNGEDPFYFATGRTPRLPVLLFDPATDPYTPATLLADAHSHNVHWLVVKRDLQIVADPMPYREASIALLLREFKPHAQLANYDLYYRP